MFHVVLHEPEIPPNTGNLMRLTVNVGAELHLVHPLGFELDDTRMRRAGLDYREHARVHHHETFDACADELAGRRMFAFSQHADTLYTDIAYQSGDVLLFGKESTGLPTGVVDHESITERVRIPIAVGGRSLNLANAAAVGIYEAWRQNGFEEVVTVE